MCCSEGADGVSGAAGARGRQPPEPRDPPRPLSLLRNPGVGEVKGRLFSEHLPNWLNASSAVHCVATDSGFIKINLVLLRRILINYPVMKNVRGTTLLHQGLMITLMDAVARFSWQGRNEKHDTRTFKCDLRGKRKLLNDTKIEQENRSSKGLNVNSQPDRLDWSTDHWV